MNSTDMPSAASKRWAMCCRYSLHEVPCPSYVKWVIVTAVEAEDVTNIRTHTMRNKRFTAGYLLRVIFRSAGALSVTGFTNADVHEKTGSVDFKHQRDFSWPSSPYPGGFAPSRMAILRPQVRYVLYNRSYFPF